MEKLKATREWLYRAIRTFIQAAVGFLATNVASYICGLDMDYIKTTVAGLCAAAVAAGIAAVMNAQNDTEAKG